MLGHSGYGYATREPQCLHHELPKAAVCANTGAWNRISECTYYLPRVLHPAVIISLGPNESYCFSMDNPWQTS